MTYPTNVSVYPSDEHIDFIIVLNGISNYKVVCDDVRMGVDNRVFFY